MSKHTPGPWKAVDQMLKADGKTVLEQSGHLICPHCEKTAGDQPASILITTKEWGVASVQSLNPKREHDQHLANASLIAAAPELLAALKAMTDYMAYAEALGEDKEVFKNARAALAKAEGVS